VTQRVASNSPAGRKNIQPDSTPPRQDTQHSPGCPAASDATSNKFVQRTVQPFAPTMSHDLVTIEPCLVTVAYQEPAPPKAGNPCPLYLANCSILI